FSTMKFWPSFCCSLSAISRAMVSGVAPAPNGTITRTVFAGHSCALAGAAAQKTKSANATKRFIDPPGRLPALGNLLVYHCGHMSGAHCRGQAKCGSSRITQRAGDTHGPCDPDPWTGRLHRHAPAHDPARHARRAHRKVWGGRLQGAVLPRLDHRRRADRLGLCALPGDRLGRCMVSPRLDGACHSRGEPGAVHVWYRPVRSRHATQRRLSPAAICIVAAYSPGQIKTTLKHPM